MQKRIDLAQLSPVVGTLYPSPFDLPCRARERRKLGDAAGLSQFGVNLLRLPPGAWSSQRHWHTAEDEFVYVLSGEVVLVTDGGEEVLRPGDAAGFPAGDANGHCLQNRSQSDAQVLEIGTRTAGDSAYYSDIDMVAPAGGKPAIYTRRDGTPYPDIRRRGP
ncbi:MAG: cupin domain-containing protein [Alphaproteobacteria bacterium]|nr:cupin domain-containing protein [Alphaproteobacteria bacterium]MBV9374689.1 cupin domain-containing protein [Alphaproteobacteria bacterium]